jgi:hypothetical protein
MSYRSQIAQLKSSLATIQAAQPTGRLTVYDADEPDELADVVSYGGNDIQMIRVPREMPFDNWIKMIQRKVVA